MPINKNHLFEDLDGIKCAVVETLAPQERVAFLKPLLEYNGYEVKIAPSPPPKAVKAKEGETQEQNIHPETFTIGVTNVMFNATNAIFGRFLQTPNGHTVTLAYWEQKEQESQDEIPYYESAAV